MVIPCSGFCSLFSSQVDSPATGVIAAGKTLVFPRVLPFAVFNVQYARLISY